jgi:hypothetical protein
MRLNRLNSSLSVDNHLRVGTAANSGVPRRRDQTVLDRNLRPRFREQPIAGRSHNGTVFQHDGGISHSDHRAGQQFSLRWNAGLMKPDAFNRDG